MLGLFWKYFFAEMNSGDVDIPSFTASRYTGAPRSVRLV